ncbi:MAG: zinc-binding dehydrogenase [bacterium]|nr:zinc-binding dehydrogenase [bacterium]
MRQAVVTGERQLEIREVGSPLLPAGGIRIQATLCGVSTGTEMAVYRGTIPNLHNGRWGYWNEYPIYPGYEMVGEVIEVDGGVSDVAVGDRVVALAPHGTEGVATPDVYVPIPDGVSDEAATLAVLGATTLHGMHRAQVRHGESVLVLGLGVVGVLSAAHARRSGAGLVVVADPLESRRAVATKLGFEHVFDPSSPEFIDRVYSLTAGRGVDVVSEAAGAEAAFQLGITCLAEYGRLLVQGTHGAPVAIDFGDYTMHRQTAIISTWNIGSPDRRDADSPVEARVNLDLSMEMVRCGELPSTELVTHRFSFDDMGRVYDDLDSGTLDSMQIVLAT